MPKQGQEHSFTVEQMRRFQDLFIQARMAKGMSQTEVAEETGLKQSWISSLERATYPSFNVLDLLTICKFYNINPSQISHILGFTQTADQLSDEANMAVSTFQQLFMELDAERQHLGIVLIRQILVGLVDTYGKNRKNK